MAASDSRLESGRTPPGLAGTVAAAARRLALRLNGTAVEFDARDQAALERTVFG